MDSVGSQYDYHSTFSDINMTTESNTFSNSFLKEDIAGERWLMKNEQANAMDKRYGSEIIAGE